MLRVLFFLLSFGLVKSWLSTSRIRLHAQKLHANLNFDDIPRSPSQQYRKNAVDIIPPVGFATFSVLTSLIMPKIVRAESKQYLTEPTEEFKDEEARVAAFNATQKKIRAQWDVLVQELAESDDPAKTAKLFRDMKAFLVNLQDIPTGVKKRELVKLCRGKKFNGRKIKSNWTTEVEIEYEKLIQEINRRLVPVNVVS